MTHVHNESSDKIKRSHCNSRLGFVASGRGNLLKVFEAEARKIVEAKYTDEWNSAGFFRRWILRRIMTAEIADIVAKRNANNGRDTLY